MVGVHRLLPGFAGSVLAHERVEPVAPRRNHPSRIILDRRQSVHEGLAHQFAQVLLPSWQGVFAHRIGTLTGEPDPFLDHPAGKGGHPVEQLAFAPAQGVVGEVEALGDFFGRRSSQHIQYHLQ